MKPAAPAADQPAVAPPSPAAATPVPPLPPAGPIDADWARRERAAKGIAPDDGDEDDDVYGDPAKVEDEGPLESLGKAVSAPVRDAAGEGEPHGRENGKG
ncbi:MAG: hypothetical protein JSR59_04400 [Proteobacteria bacterium]|nr:hypothetical protein [Pseudomonadota bacterium]